MLTLVLGGARSGKSRFAQSLCETAGRVVFVATARLDDDDMRARAAHHQQARPKHWHTIEEPLEIARVVETCGADFDLVLIDCLTLWLSNLCWEHRDHSARSSADCGFGRSCTALIMQQRSARWTVIVVLRKTKSDADLVP